MDLEDLNDNTEQTETPKTRSEYLQGKTELSDVDIINILDLPVEKENRTEIKSYTEQDYSYLKNDEKNLFKLAERLEKETEYLTYHGSYIAKSKLLYEQPVTLCNEIPCLLIGHEINEKFYLLPYGYAKDSSEKYKKFADMLESKSFIDIKRNFGSSIRNNFKKGHQQGKNIFFFINGNDLDYESCKKELCKCVYNRKNNLDKTASYIIYEEKSNRCGYFIFDSDGKLADETEYHLKEIRSFASERPLVVRGGTQNIPSSTSVNINGKNNSVNDVFNSLLIRGEISMLRKHPEIKDSETRFQNALNLLEAKNKEINDRILQASNNKFIQKEKELSPKTRSEYPQEKKMENTSSEDISYENEEMSKAAAIKERNQQKKLTTQMILDQEDKEQMENISATMKSATKDFMDLNATTITEEEKELPTLKTHSELKEEKIQNLQTVTQEEFNNIVESLYQPGKPDYKNIPEIIRLPKINSEVAEKLGIENENFFLKTNVAHVRPQRKGGYNQSLRKEEMKGMLDFIASCQTAYIDSDERHQNFFLAGLDEQDNTKSNKIVFNKDKLGNYIVTIGKVDTFNLEEPKYTKVAVGVEPTIWMEQKAPSIATMLRSSTTLATENIQHNSDSVKQEENPSVQMEPRLMKKFDEMKKAIENREKQEGQTAAEKTESAGSKKAESHEKPKVDLIKKAAKDFISAIKNGTAPFLNTSENDFGKILLHPAAIVNASNGLPFSGEAQLLAQIYHQQQKMEGEIVTTFEGAKESGTFIADKPEAKKNFVLANKTEQQQKEIIQKTRYFMPEACTEPDKIYAHALQMQRPQKISDYRDLIRHFENIPNGQKEISDLRIRIAHEHLKEIQSRFALKEKRILTVDEINERKKILQDYFKSLPEKHRESEKSAFENTFGLTLNPEEVFKTNLEGNFKNKKFEDVVKSNEKLTDQANRRLSAFIQNNSMEDKKLSEILHEEYNEQLKEEKSTSKKLKIEAKGITEPETYLGKYLAACSSNAEFVTDEDTIKAVQANLVKKLEENYRLEKYGILKEIGQQAQKISNETTSKIAFDKAHSNKNIKEKNIAKEIGPVGMGN